MQDLRQTINDTIDRYSHDLLSLSHLIHSSPELSMREHQACAHIAACLAEAGRAVELGTGGLATSFKASTVGLAPRPHITFMAEYDALPDIGHACGHNIIAAAAVGAYIGLAAVVDKLHGAVSLIGTPGEEADGGKILLLDAGVFGDVDYALMIHPSSGKSLLARGGRAATSVKVSFQGQAAHSSVPSRGINALSGVISTFNHIDMLRPTFNADDNVNGIITHGGTASNVIPAAAACEFSLRAATVAALRGLVDKVKLSVEAAERLTGAVAQIEVGLLYAERYPNKTMSGVFQQNMSELGEAMEWANPVGMYGSSDIGNVSMVLPSLHDYLNIAPSDVNTHNAAFTAYAASQRADEVVIKAAKGLALTALEILESEDLQRQIQEEFRLAVNTAPQ